jgi:hypothetical protein
MIFQSLGLDYVYDSRSDPIPEVTIGCLLALCWGGVVHRFTYSNLYNLRCGEKLNTCNEQ